LAIRPFETHLELLDEELLIGAVSLTDGLFGSGANPPPPHIGLK